MSRLSSARAALREWSLRFWGVISGRRADDDIRLELAAHIELAEEDLRRKGYSPQDAARLARVRFGNSTPAMESVREQRGIPHLSTFFIDVKLGLRMLRKYWALSLIGGMAMAMAITMGASVFELLHVVRGTTIPLEEGDRVVVIQPFDTKTQQESNSSLEDFERWSSELRSVEDAGAFRTTQRDLATINGPSAPVPVAEMSASGFETARVAPLLGRALLAGDEIAGAPPVVVIGYDAWQSTFAGDPAVIGQEVQLDSVFHTIVGVMPEDFAFPVNHQYWTSLGTGIRGRVVVFARLAPGTDLERAQAEVETVGLLEPNSATEAGPPLRPRVVPYVIGMTGIPVSESWRSCCRWSCLCFSSRRASTSPF